MSFSLSLDNTSSFLGTATGSPLKRSYQVEVRLKEGTEREREIDGGG